MKKACIYSLIVLTALTVLSCNSKETGVQIIPERGIVYNGDSILIDKTSPAESVRILGIKDTFEITEFDWCGYTAEGEPAYGTGKQKIISFRGLELTYNIRGLPEEMKLESISAAFNNQLHMEVNKDLFLGGPANKIETYFPIKNPGLDEISANKMYFSLGSYGITFTLDSVGKKRIISRIQI